MQHKTNSNQIEQQSAEFLMQVMNDFGSIQAAKNELTQLLVNLNIQDDQESITAKERRSLALMVDALNVFDQ